MPNSLSQEEAIFQAALEIAAADERTAYLDEACRAQPELRRRVEALLRRYAESSGPLDRPAGGLAATTDESRAECPGAVIGPYKLLEEIGEGGFGVVFMAEQSQPVRRKVALKVLKPGMDTRQVVARFEAERQALALMDHPNIAHVFDGGETASGRPYFVMELVRGVPVTEFCDRNSLPIRQRLELFVTVCQAVQHAHQKGIIHRDLKPTNVLIASHDGTPVVKVIDFGIAKTLSSTLTDKTLFTGFAQMIGTPAYMSPEQAGQSSLDVDTRSDIYSLGVLLYELLTGTTPFDAQTLKKLGYDEMRRMIRNDEPPRPSERISTLKNSILSTVAGHHGVEPRKLSQQLRGELDWIVMKCLEKDRNHRYESAADLAHDIKRYLHDEPVQACPPSAGYRLRKFVRRNRGPVLAVSLVLLALVAGIVGTTWGLIRADRAREDAVAAQLAEADRAKGERRARDAETVQRLRAEENAKLATAAVEEIVAGARQRLALYTPDQPTPVPKKPEGEKLERELLEKGLRFYEQLAQINATDWAARRRRAKAYESVGRLQSDLRNYAKSEKAHREAVRLMEELAQERPNDFDNAYDLADAHRWLCRACRESGRFGPAEEVSRHGLALFEKLAIDFPDRRLQAQKGVGFCQWSLFLTLQKAGKAREAEKAFQEFLTTWAELLAAKPDAPELRNALAHSYHDFANVLRETGKAPEAEKAYRQAIDIWEKLANEWPEKPEYPQHAAGTCNQLTELLLATKQTSEAEQFHRRALALYAKLADDFPAEPVYRHLQAATYGALGELLGNTGRVAEAEAAYRQAIALWEKLAAQWPDRREYPQSAARALSALAERVYAGRAQAEEFHRRALALYAKLAAHYPDEKIYRQWQAGGTWRLGAVLHSAGRPAEAEFTFHQAVALYEKLIADYPREPWYRSQLAYTCWLLGGLLRSTGRPQDGEKACRQAVANQEKLAADFPDKAVHRSGLFTFLGELAENLLQQGKHAEAAKVAERMAEALRKDPKASETAAAVLGRCVPLAEKDARLSDADRKATAKRYADRSKELARAAAKMK